ncbi:diguanylate cyclase [Curvibacter sp. HBC28]|uniref:diguanylate cyclase n=1 Tax=Curvibacter microcysteis TaxID=3026419 RepID=A0ABT5MAQ4_9BURK|nr:diguanylate cyclase [Curvibacter sp. HBC28]MDD0813667.1 diguanylate cyclase [Curvibacter sp. HBC28]
MKLSDLFKRTSGHGLRHNSPDLRAEPTALAEALLQACAHLLTHRLDPDESIRWVFDALLRSAPHVRLAWSWAGPPDVQQIEPRNVCGPARSYLDGVALERSPLTESGPAFRLLKRDQPVSHNITADSPYGPWRRAYQVHGLRSVLGLPLRADSTDRRGMVVFYADREDYFQQLGMGLFDSLATLLSAVVVQADQQSQLAREAQQDPLTGLLNRRSINGQQQQLGKDRERSSSVLLLDLDHFKAINDELGHLAGDEVLKTVARRLLDGVRSADRVARWGGEEFLVWLPSTPREGARLVAESLRERIGSTPIALPSGEVRVTVSIGVAEMLPDEHLEPAVARADEVLYEAKRSGRNRVRLWQGPVTELAPLTLGAGALQRANRVPTGQHEDPHVAIIGKQLDGQITSWNLGAERLFGYTEQEMLGRNIALLLPADRLHEEQHIIDRLQRGDPIEALHTTRLHRDGHPVDVTVSVTPLRGPGGTIVGAAKTVRIRTPSPQALR